MEITFLTQYFSSYYFFLLNMENKDWNFQLQSFYHNHLKNQLNFTFKKNQSKIYILFFVHSFNIHSFLQLGEWYFWVKQQVTAKGLSKPQEWTLENGCIYVCYNISHTRNTRSSKMRKNLIMLSIYRDWRITTNINY